MAIPVLIVGAGVAAGIGWGIGLGYKLGRYAFGETVEASISNVNDTYRMQLKLLQYSLSDGFLDKKIYGYYLYSLILSQQELLIKLEKQLAGSEYIEYFKNTSELWEEQIADLTADVNDTLKRYLCYATFFKDIFGIKYDETNLDNIREKILPFDMLSEKQLNDLILYIINPLFNGWFDFTAENINVIKCSKFNILNSEKNVCISIVIKQFPIPQLAEPSQKEYPNHNEATFDAIKPWRLADLIISKKSLAKGYMDSFMGAVDSTIEQFTGIKKSYSISGAKKAEDLANTAADWANNMKREFAELRRSLSDLYTNTTSGFGDFVETLKIAAIAGGALLAFKLFTGDRNE